MSKKREIEKAGEGKKMNELLTIFGFVALWFALQLWILPKMGVST
jgi:hypothetical protein